MSVVVAPPEPPRPDELELLIREARARARRRRLLAAAVIAVAAAVVFGVHAVTTQNAAGSAATNRPRVQPAAVSSCRLSSFRVHRIGSFAGLGQSGGRYGLTNLTRRTCELRGWPYVVAVKADGTAATGVTARQTFYGPFRAPKRPPLVTLKPGATAAFVLTAGDNPVGNVTRCALPYWRLRIGFAKGSRSVTISAWIPYLDSYLQDCTPFVVSEIVPTSDLRG